MVIQYQNRYRDIENHSAATSHLDKDTPCGCVPEINSWEEGFTLTCSVLLGNIETENTLLEIPEMLKVYTRLHQREERSTQNYSSYPMQDGSIPVLEALLWLEDEAGHKRPMTVGLPLSMLDEPLANMTYVYSSQEWNGAYM